jgi:hypothetical protein
VSESLSAQANKAEIERVRAEKPSQFTVGGHYDFATRTVTGGITYDRKITNALGLTGYWKAYWNDLPIYPQNKFGMVIGAEGVYQFTPK